MNGCLAPRVGGLAQPVGVQGFDEQRGGDVAAGNNRLIGGEGLLDRHGLQPCLLTGAGCGGVVVQGIRDDQGIDHIGDQRRLIDREGDADPRRDRTTRFLDPPLTDLAAHHLFEDGDRLELEGLPAGFRELEQVAACEAFSRRSVRPERSARR